ncbi:MAG: rubredoxin [Pseudomonadota bacterium]
MSDEPYKIWQCLNCGYIYDEEEGDADEGLAPGTRWADIPDAWICPQCGSGKMDFEMAEV